MSPEVPSSLIEERSRGARRSEEGGAPVVEVRLLRAGAAPPRYQTDGAAGMDLSACPVGGEAIELPAGAIRVIPCGVALAIPMGFEGQVRPRSGLASRHGVTLPNAPGTIDSDYRGEVMVPLINLGGSAFVVTPGMRVAQLVIAPVSRAVVRVCGSLDATERGEGGFGSTGV